MNPMNAMNLVVSTTITPTTPIVPTTPTTPVSSTPPTTPNLSTTTTPESAAAPQIFITPDVLQALQAYVVNNFPDLGLPQDIQQVTKQFFVNIPPVVPVASPVTTITPTTSDNSSS